jgi:CubicO group peptidase (beta-lactamase class C family)
VPSIPSIPRLPLVPDLLRRSQIPKDLDAATATGPEEKPEAGGLESENVERMWKAGLDLYRSGVHPALQLCVRRHGRVVLDRAIGHARGNGPSDSADEPKVAATPDTPFCVYSSSKAITAMVVHLLDERGALDIEDRVAEYIPEYERGISAALVTSGKPVVYPELPRFLGVMSTVTSECPKVPESELLF